MRWDSCGFMGAPGSHASVRVKVCQISPADFPLTLQAVCHKSWPERSCDFWNKLTSVRVQLSRSSTTTHSVNRKASAHCRAVWAVLLFAAVVLLLEAWPVAAQDAVKEPAYRNYPLIGPRPASLPTRS